VRWTLLIERNLSFARLEAIQIDLVQRVQKNPDEGFLLVSEPEPTFTKGRFADDTGCLWNAEQRAKEGVTVAEVSRGGQWTYHGPGQILFYPIVALESLGFSRRAVYELVTRLRDGIAAPLIEGGIRVEKKSKPFGLYAAGKKLSSFGIAVERGICSHGVALYWSDQSRYFEGICPCGVPGQQAVSLQELGWSKSWEDTARQVAHSIEKSLIK